MTRKRCKRKVVAAMPPRGLRPILAKNQVLDLSLVHAVNLDAIAKGQADEAMLWDWIGSVLTGRTGRVAFDGPDYQLAKVGMDVMDQLAERVDRHTANVAGDWAEMKVNEMADACAWRQNTGEPVERTTA